MHALGGPVRKDLVLVGGGHSHVTVLKRFGMKPEPGVRITLICRDAHAPYSGMLPGLIAGHYEFDEAHIDLGPLAQFAGARFLHDEVIGLDRETQRVVCRNRPPVRYDVLSIDIGSSPRIDDLPGARGVVVPVKPIDGFARKWRELSRKLLEPGPRRVLAVVGAGAGGVELLLSVQCRLRAQLRERGQPDDAIGFRLYSKTKSVLPTHNAGVQRRFRRVLRERGIDVRSGVPVVAVQRDEGRVALTLADDTRDLLDEVLLVTSAGCQSWPGDAGLAVDDRGFVLARDTLQSVTDEAIFVSGDAASVVDHPRPKAGVFAVRQGPPLTANLRRAARGRAPRPFQPQREFLSLISTGDRYAVASRSFWSFEGAWVWRWKDWIDRRFMRKFNELPKMSEAAEPQSARSTATDAVEEHGARADLHTPTMRCAGCGSKVGARVLERVMQRLHLPTAEGVVIGLDAPDDAAAIEVPPGHVVVQTVDSFRAFVDDPYVFGRITAVHALGDIHSMGARPHSAMAIATVPFGDETRIEEDLFHLMSGLISVLSAEGMALVGGHTNEGAELALGLAVTGFARPQELLRKSGALPGQALVVTKPLGTGALFAADMRGRARGRWVQAALASMAVSNAEGARILRAQGATAMTDVTGFGLLGHLYEILRASACAAELHLAGLPWLDGVREVMSHGIFSSLQPENLRLRRIVTCAPELADSDAYALLFDPQTAGGLLASVPLAAVGGALEQLRGAGYPHACVVGHTRAGDPGVGVT